MSSPDYDGYNDEKETYIQLLDLLEEAVSKNKLFFSNKNVVLEMIDELKNKLPEEMSRAYEIVDNEKQIIARAREDANEIRKSAEREAEEIVTDANEQAEELTSQHQITRNAEAMAQAMYEESVKYKNEMHKSANDYVLTVLEQAQDKLINTMDSIKRVCEEVEQNRESFENFTNKDSQDGE